MAGDSGLRQQSPSAGPMAGQAAAAPGQPLITATTPERPVPAPADSVVRVPRAARPAADPAKPAAQPKKGEEPLRDSAYGPKFKVDSMGKVTPIKKP